MTCTQCYVNKNYSIHTCMLFPLNRQFSFNKTFFELGWRFVKYHHHHHQLESWLQCASFSQLESILAKPLCHTINLECYIWCILTHHIIWWHCLAAGVSDKTKPKMLILACACVPWLLHYHLWSIFWSITEISLFCKPQSRELGWCLADG